MPRFTPYLAALAAGVLAVTATGCGGTAAGDGPGAAPSGSAIALPARYHDKDTLVIGVVGAVPPQSFVPPGAKEPQGVDPDLGRALAAVLGKKVVVRPMPFDSILPALAAGRADLGMSGFTDTKQRQQVVDFVDYLDVGSSLFGTPDKVGKIKSLADLCGHSVAVARATAQVPDVTEQAAKCTREGKPPVKISVYPDQNAANLDITSGRSEVSDTDTTVAAHLVSASSGQLALLGEPYNKALEGIAVAKDSGLAEPVRAALEKLMADGTYRQVLRKWNVEQIAVDKPTVNGGTR
ncbi:ABC transporter substrate-binding protein [Amycolatopsis jejuensis]|uniref:ABC transporter substrate-binding protein n=1 Tax=Amycolatopsis jejuensis TaxID=330084 RepID=UPI0005270DF2|nr:ABC transporter substrate-binding protein [Amycolatopsis jejuensis]